MIKYNIFEHFIFDIKYTGLNKAFTHLLKNVFILLKNYLTYDCVKFWIIIISSILVIKILKYIKSLYLINSELNINSKKYYAFNKFGIKAIKKAMLKSGVNDFFIIDKENKEYYKTFLAKTYGIKNNDKKINNDPSYCLDDKLYKNYLTTIKHHYLYKTNYIKGVILWMSSTFLAPFICRFIYEHSFSFDSIVNSIMTTVWFIWFTKGLLLIPTFIIGCIIHPIMLKFVLFHKKLIPYSSDIMENIGYKNNEKANAIGIFAGTFIGRFL